jgi:hypothetical protein
MALSPGCHNSARLGIPTAHSAFEVSLTAINASVTFVAIGVADFDAETVLLVIFLCACYCQCC